ncbi:Cupin domain-containing protein [Neolewinella xylanilytica]|uniref:Cupin domain-containing protein n=1 Tax=Neolewinella xylanilytica TaxID=1514080 RepID=A0A2S6I201_9BACT|nr:cupin domain-containing protein [Neolewinella xylanilytica]PPK85202.1 Cupin domain-containing protein [Neolewinella xylanilytica]
MYRYLLPIFFLLTLPVVAQQASPNGRYYENLPHGKVLRDVAGARAVYLPAGRDTLHSIVILTTPERLLDSIGGVYLPWILDNLIAQGAIRATAAVLRSDPDTSDRNRILAEINRMGVPVAATARWEPVPTAKTTAAMLAALLAGEQHLPEHVDGGSYPFPENTEDAVLYAGPTAHFPDLVMERWDLAIEAAPTLVNSADREQIFILREGNGTVEVGDSSWSLTPESVLLLAAGDSAMVRSTGEAALVAYRMHYPNSGPVGSGASFVVPYKTLTFQPHDRGGQWKYFERSTPTCPYYEMHKTQLNPGIKSHEPHVHAAAEIVIMIEGTTEMEIGDHRYTGQAGDVYYLPSQVPHAIRNTGESSGTYLAFQWDSQSGH